VPESIITLLPPSITKRKPSGATPEPAVPVPATAVPSFGPPAHMVPDNFWDNLRQFLTERPVKVKERADAPFTRTSFGAGVGDNLKEFLSSRPVPKGPINSRLAVNWGGNFGGFFYRIREFISPTKLPPLQVTSRPVKVRDIWSKDEAFGWTQAISIGLHVVVFALAIFVPIWLTSKAQAVTKQLDVTPIDLSPYIAKLPAGANKAGGGGGANNHTLAPPNRGKLPKFTWTQFAAPQVHPINQNPKLAMDPSLLGPPDLKVPSPNLMSFGDPFAKAYSDSLGNGNGTGIGSGTGGGLGPGEGGGTGGGAFRAGVNGVGIPVCIYCPNPQYSDEARKAKYQGTVTLLVTVTIDGRAINASVVKGPGLGLEEKALEAVKTWRLKPAVGPGGKPVPVIVPIEVTFRLY
jgi:protein TonB